MRKLFIIPIIAILFCTAGCGLFKKTKYPPIPTREPETEIPVGSYLLKSYIMGPYNFFGEITIINANNDEKRRPFIQSITGAQGDELKRQEEAFKQGVINKGTYGLCKVYQDGTMQFDVSPSLNFTFEPDGGVIVVNDEYFGLYTDGRILVDLVSYFDGIENLPNDFVFYAVYTRQI